MCVCLRVCVFMCVCVCVCVCVYVCVCESLVGYSSWGCKESDMTEHDAWCAHVYTHPVGFVSLENSD